jgi:hypothetical protein
LWIGKEKHTFSKQKLPEEEKVRTIINIGLVAIFLTFGVWYAWDQGYLYPRFEETGKFWHHSAIIVEKNTGATYQPFLDPFPFISLFRIDSGTPDTVYVDTIQYVKDYGYSEHADFINGLLHVNGSTKAITIAEFHTCLGRKIEPMNSSPDLGMTTGLSKESWFDSTSLESALLMGVGCSNGGDLFFDPKYKYSGSPSLALGSVPLLLLIPIAISRVRREQEEDESNGNDNE